MNILHLASWYPTEDSPINGIFIERKIKAISDGDKQNKHYFISLASASFASLKKPLDFIRLKIKSSSNTKNIGLHFFGLMKWLFGDVIGSIVAQHTNKMAVGKLEFQNAEVDWFLSIDS